MKTHFATALPALMALFMVGCAVSPIEHSGPTVSLLPAGVAPEHTASLLVSGGIEVTTFDGSLLWESLPAGEVTGLLTGILNPNGGEQNRTLLLAPRTHVFTFRPTARRNVLITSGGELVLIRAFEAGRKYRVIRYDTAGAIGANLETIGTDGKWTLVKPIPIDPRQTITMAVQRATDLKYSRTQPARAKPRP